MSKVKLFYYQATKTINGVTTETLSLNCPGCGTPVKQGVTHECRNGVPVERTQVIQPRPHPAKKMKAATRGPKR